jgi:hypothetical protein
MSFRFEFEAMHLARLRGAPWPARKSGSVQRLPRRGTAVRRGAAQAPLSRGAEASGLERDARAGISPDERSRGAGWRNRRDDREMCDRQAGQ